MSVNSWSSKSDFCLMKPMSPVHDLTTKYETDYGHQFINRSEIRAYNKTLQGSSTSHSSQCERGVCQVQTPQPQDTEA